MTDLEAFIEFFGNMGVAYTVDDDLNEYDPGFDEGPEWKTEIQVAHASFRFNDKGEYVVVHDLEMGSDEPRLPPEGK